MNHLLFLQAIRHIVKESAGGNSSFTKPILLHQTISPKKNQKDDRLQSPPPGNYFSCMADTSIAQFPPFGYLNLTL